MDGEARLHELFAGRHGVHRPVAVALLGMYGEIMAELGLLNGFDE